MAPVILNVVWVVVECQFLFFKALLIFFKMGGNPVFWLNLTEYSCLTLLEWYSAFELGESVKSGGCPPALLARESKGIHFGNCWMFENRQNL